MCKRGERLPSRNAERADTLRLRRRSTAMIRREAMPTVGTSMPTNEGREQGSSTARHYGADLSKGTDEECERYKQRFSRLTNGCALEMRCLLAVAHIRGSYWPKKRLMHGGN
jgi:hypothetical protein